MRRPLLQSLIVCALASFALQFAPLASAGTGARLALALVWLGGLFWAGFALHRHLLRRAAGN